MPMKDTTISLTDYLSEVPAWLLSALKFICYGVFVSLDISPYQSLILLIFMGVDTVLGIWKSIRLGIDIEWKVLWVGITCKLAVLIVPMLVALLGKGLNYDFKIVVDVCMKLLILNEFLSCITNILSIRTKVNITNKDFIAVFLNTLRTYATNLIYSLINSIPKK